MSRLSFTHYTGTGIGEPPWGLTGAVNGVNPIYLLLIVAYVTVCVIPCFERKTTSTINIELVHIFSLGKLRHAMTRRSKGRRVMKCAAGMGIHVDMTA